MSFTGIKSFFSSFLHRRKKLVGKKPLVNRLEDGSILIEWIDRKWRFGISIEESLPESSWYLATRKGDIDSYGELSEKFLKLIKRDEI